MPKLIILQKQLNNCEWEIELSSYNVADIIKAKDKLKIQGIKFKTTIYKEIANKHPYKVSFTEMNLDYTRLSVSINILNCLENDKVTDEDVVIRKSKNSFTVYLWETDEVTAVCKATEIYRVHKEYFLRKSISKVSNN